MRCVPRSSMARMDRPTLEAMLSAMQDSFRLSGAISRPEAQRLGKEKLAWWDVFAPLANQTDLYTWDEARDFVLANFGNY